MSRTIRTTDKTNPRHAQLRRINAQRGFRPLTHRQQEAMRERAFTAVFGREKQA